MAKHLQRQVEDLKELFLFVGSRVEDAIAGAFAALFNRDADLAERVILDDVEIDRLEVTVEEECLKTLALYQPVAIDLRFVVAILKINNDLERMGDLAKNIAKRALYLAKNPPVEMPHDLQTMASKAQAMVKRSLDALVNHDVELARRVREDDDEVDSYRRTINEWIAQQIQAHPEQSETLMKLHSVTKHLERLGDMATNVAEDVIYMVEGEIVRHQSDE